MGAQVRLRCWAKNADEPLCCEADDDDHYWHRGGGAQWSDRECAPHAHALGRETAALRILEVAHEIDRLNFMRGFATDDEVRAIASRLMFNGNRAASSDLAQLEWRSANTADRDYVKLLDAAADILRPFANR
jgi:hypothetical protein